MPPVPLSPLVCHKRTHVMLSYGPQNCREAASPLKNVPDAERGAAWDEIEQELRRFEGPGGFEIPTELRVGVGVK